jgi:integrase
LITEKEVINYKYEDVLAVAMKNKNKSLADFLELYSRSNTKRVYQAGIYNFIEFISKVKRKGRKATSEEMEQFNNLINQYFNDGRDYFDDILRFAASLNSKPPKSAKAYLSGVKEFLGYNGIEFTQRQIKNINLKLPKGNARTVKNDIDSTVIRKISEHTDVKGRALFFTLKSTGMRIGEALQITLDELDLNSSPACVTIRGEHTKNGQQRITFIDREAKDVLNEWLKIREKYLEAAVNKNNGLVKNGVAKPKAQDDNRLFPFSDSVAEQMWTTAITNAGLLSIDKVTNRKQLRIHDLRMFYRSQLALGCPVDIVEELMGHEGYLTGSYRQYSKAQMAEHYLKHEYLLYIQMPKDIQRIESEFKTELNDNRKLVENLILENAGFKKEIGVLQEMVTIHNSDLSEVDKTYREDLDRIFAENRELKQELESIKQQMQRKPSV